jgi:hypothetical protein
MNTFKIAIYSALIVIPAFLLFNLYGMGGVKSTNKISINASTWCPFQTNIEYLLVPGTPNQNDTTVIARILTGENLRSCEYVEYDFGKYYPHTIISELDGSDLSKHIRAHDGGWKYIIKGEDIENEHPYYDVKFIYADSVNALSYSESEVKVSLSLSKTQVGYSNDRGEYISIRRSSSRAGLFLSEHLVLKRIMPKEIAQKLSKGSMQYLLEQGGTTVASWKDPEKEKSKVIMILVLSVLFGAGVTGFVELFVSRSRNS